MYEDFEDTIGGHKKL